MSEQPKIVRNGSVSASRYLIYPWGDHERRVAGRTLAVGSRADDLLVRVMEPVKRSMYLPDANCAGLVGAVVDSRSGILGSRLEIAVTEARVVTILTSVRSVFCDPVVVRCDHVDSLVRTGKEMPIKPRER